MHHIKLTIIQVAPAQPSTFVAYQHNGNLVISPIAMVALVEKSEQDFNGPDEWRPGAPDGEPTITRMPMPLILRNHRYELQDGQIIAASSQSEAETIAKQC